MKLIKTFQPLKTIKFLKNDIALNVLLSVSVLTLIAFAIWFGGPLITWDDYSPLFQPEKRIYTIIILCLVWLLKFLIIDLAAPSPFQAKDAFTRKKLQELQSRFQGAVRFLKKTAVTKQGKSLRLNQLPWCLLIGPSGAGKTALLAKSGANFVLRRRLNSKDQDDFQTSEHCDWWVTRDVSIIDVPGKYLTADYVKNGQSKINVYPILWRYFLRLIKKQLRKSSLSGIIIALPLPEIMLEGNSKKYQTSLHHLFQRIHELKKLFPHTIPCQLVITKCDLLPGFAEFFAESSHDEIIQTWGITLPPAKKGEKIADLFTQRFNALIKKLNSQLIWRLHQERNPMARPYIKDFPLQVERSKEFIVDFLMKFSLALPNTWLQGVCLTSALQIAPDTEKTILDESINNTQRALQIFKEPAPTTRSYFIKQFISHGLISPQPATAITPLSAWKSRTAYTVSIGVIACTAILLGRDFEQGVKQAYAVQNNLSDYRLAVAQLNDPDEHLLQTLNLLNTLQQATKNKSFKLDFSHLLSFYSHQSQQKASTVYYQALQTILLPEIKNYLEEYLKNPVNKDADNVYAALKAYLMLGDTAHFKAEVIANTMRDILPKKIQPADATSLIHHIDLALHSAWNPQALNSNLIQETRHYFIAMPGLQLGYVILKNIDNNKVDSQIDLGTNVGLHPVLVNTQIKNHIPVMFTVKAFTTVLAEQASAAAQETLVGNWILGEDAGANKNAVLATALIEDLRSTYISKYVTTWENLLTSIQISPPNNLEQIDRMIINLVSNDSPLLQLLYTVHDNTYFDPIASSSQKLLDLGALVTKDNSSDTLLNQIFTSLRSLHQYLQPILTAEDERKAAFYAVSVRMHNHDTPDALTQLRLVAEKSPEPIKSWLEKIANHTWHFLMKDAGNYIDTSWRNQVTHIYEANIANRYPFNTNADHEVDIQKFTEFFGNPGIVFNFYNTYLQSFVDASTSDWHWRTLDDNKLPFSDETLRQIQHAMRIHHSFFPNGDNKLFVQFTLQPYQFGKDVKQVNLNINDKQFADTNVVAKQKSNQQHIIAWPGEHGSKSTSVQLVLGNNRQVGHTYEGAWGWFKLVNQSFESVVTKKEMLLNLSMNEQPAKYLLFTDEQFNPFISLNLRHFRLPAQLTENKA